MSAVEKPTDLEAPGSRVGSKTSGTNDVPAESEPGILSSRLTLGISLLLLAAAVILSLVSVVLVARHPPVQHQPQQRSAGGVTECPFSEITENPLVCFINYESAVPGFTGDHIPTQLCRHIVLCCMTTAKREEVVIAISKGFIAQKALPRAKRFVGFGGPSVSYVLLNDLFDKNFSSLSDSLMRAMRGGFYNGGIALMCPDAIRITTPGLAESVVKLLYVTMVHHGGNNTRLIVQLSTQAHDVKTIYTARTFFRSNVIPMMTTHMLPLQRQKLRYATCVSPYRSADPRLASPDHDPHVVSVSAENAIHELKMAYGSEWPDLEKQVMVTVSLAWLQFDHDKSNRSAGTPARFEGLIPYPDICLKTCSGCVVFTRSFDSCSTRGQSCETCL